MAGRCRAGNRTGLPQVAETCGLERPPPPESSVAGRTDNSVARAAGCPQLRTMAARRVRTRPDGRSARRPAMVRAGSGTPRGRRTLRTRPLTARTPGVAVRLIFRFENVAPGQRRRAISPRRRGFMPRKGAPPVPDLQPRRWDRQCRRVRGGLSTSPPRGRASGPRFQPSGEGRQFGFVRPGLSTRGLEPVDNPGFVSRLCRWLPVAWFAGAGGRPGTPRTAPPRRPGTGLPCP